MGFMFGQSKMIAIRLLAAILVGGLSIGIHAQPAGVAPKKQNSYPKNAKTPDVSIKGQVFVVTKGGDSVKLALVSVAAYRESELIPQFAAIRNSDKDEINRTTEAMEEANKMVSDAHSRVEMARAKYRDIPFEDRGTMDSANLSMAVIQKSEEVQIALRHQKRTFEKLALLNGPRHVIERLTSPLVAAKSDADGNFEMLLPANAYVLVATGKRLVGGSTELYEWMVRVDAKKPVKLMLSNDNLVGSGCAECVLM